MFGIFVSKFWHILSYSTYSTSTRQRFDKYSTNSRQTFDKYLTKIRQRSDTCIEKKAPIRFHIRQLWSGLPWTAMMSWLSLATQPMSPSVMWRQAVKTDNAAREPDMNSSHLRESSTIRMLRVYNLLSGTPAEGDLAQIGNTHSEILRTKDGVWPRRIGIVFKLCLCFRRFPQTSHIAGCWPQG